MSELGRSLVTRLAVPALLIAVSFVWMNQPAYGQFGIEAPAVEPNYVLWGIYGLIGFIILYFVILRGIFRVRDDQVGVLTKKYFGKNMPEGQIIARRGENGVQAKTLMPGLYWRFPLIWSWKKVAVTRIPMGQLGAVESIDGVQLRPGRLLADEVDCNTFQDAQMFLDNRGQKGIQVAILRPGDYRINPDIFKVKMYDATKILPEEVGIVTAQDGLPLQKEYIIAPPPLTEVEEGDTEYTDIKPHSSFQNGQAFINAKGHRGTQRDTLQPGEYYINPNLFKVDVYDIAEVPPGFVMILRSNVGRENEQVIPPDTDVHGPMGRRQTDLEQVALSLLIDDMNRRGIYKIPMQPGKYNLNVIAYTGYLVPVSAVTVDWAAGTDPRTGRSVGLDDVVAKRRTVVDNKDAPDRPYIERSTELKAEDFFKFSQLEVTSKDGFQLGVDVRMVIRILPENAAFIIARFGSVVNLIEQIVHPLIDSAFRNKAGEKKAIDFFQSRALLQQEALEHAKDEFRQHRIEAQNLLISFIRIDEKLLDTQKQKEIALQQQAQFQEMSKAEAERIAVEEKKSRANKQAEVVAAQLQIDINKNRAVAAVEEARGQRDSIKEKAIGEAAAVEMVGKATAAAYKAQADVIGPGNLTLVNVMEKIGAAGLRITPDTLVYSGDGDGKNNAGLFSAWLVDMVSKNSGSGDKPKKEPVEKKDDEPGITTMQEETKTKWRTVLESAGFSKQDIDNLGDLGQKTEQEIQQLIDKKKIEAQEVEHRKVVDMSIESSKRRKDKDDGY